MVDYRPEQKTYDGSGRKLPKSSSQKNPRANLEEASTGQYDHQEK